MNELPAKWTIKKVKLSDARPMENNPRVIQDRNLAGLEASIERFGYVEPIVWNERTGHIVGGHQRYGILKSKGVKEAVMVVVDLSPEDEDAANLTLNNPKIEGTWDDTALSLLKGLEESSGQLFGVLNMDTLRDTLEKNKPEPMEHEDLPPKGLDVDAEDAKPEPDTVCPCCGHKWDVKAEDVSVEETE